MRNCHPIPGRQFAFVHLDFGQPGLDRVGLGNPLGIEDHVGGGHGHGVQVSLGTLIAASRGVPAVEHKGVRLKHGRIIRLEVIAAQPRFVLDRLRFVCQFSIVIIEFQIIAIAGVVEFCVVEGSSNLCASFRIKGESGDFNKLFYCNRVSTACRLVFIEKLVFSVKPFYIVVSC